MSKFGKLGKLGKAAKGNNDQALTIAEITDNLHWVAIHNLDKNRKIARRKISAVEKLKNEFMNRDLKSFIAQSEYISSYNCNRKRYIKEIEEIKADSVISSEGTAAYDWFNAPTLSAGVLNKSEPPFEIGGISIGDALTVKPFQLELVSEKNLQKAIERYEKSKKSIKKLRVLNERMLDYQRNCLIAVKYYDELIKEFRATALRFGEIVEANTSFESGSLKYRIKKIFSDKQKCCYTKLSIEEQKVLDRMVILTDLILEALRLPITSKDGYVNVNLKSDMENLIID